MQLDHRTPAKRPLRRVWPGVMALAAVFAAGACSPPPAVTYESPGEVALQPAVVPVTVPELATDPEQYVGKTVTIAGEVNRVFGQRWFSIGGTDFGGKQVLVLGTSTLPVLVTSVADSIRAMNDIVQVTGVVRIFEEDELEREIPGLDLDGDVLDLFDAEPVIVATELDVTPRIDVTPAVLIPVPVPVLREVEIFIPNRASLNGRSAALYDVRVDSVLSRKAFWIGQSSGQRVLVVANDSAAMDSTQLKKGDMIFVAGVLRQVPGNLDQVRSSWGIMQSADEAIRKETVYLDAYRVERIGAGSKK